MLSCNVTWLTVFFNELLIVNYNYLIYQWFPWRYIIAWINNCVGHFNHRYFISFCIFMCLGTIYVTISSRNIFIKHFFHDWVRSVRKFNYWYWHSDYQFVVKNNIQKKKKKLVLRCPSLHFSSCNNVKLSLQGYFNSAFPRTHCADNSLTYM